MIPQGERNDSLARLAGAMRRVGAGEDAIAAALLETNRTCDPPLEAEEVFKIAASVVRYEPETPTRIVPLEVLTAQQVAELPEPDSADELLGGLLVRGERTVLGAHTGHGKTSFALQMLRSVARGDSFLEFNGVGGRALSIDAEQGVRSLKRRVRELEMTAEERVDFCRVPGGLTLDRDEGDRAAVEAVLCGGYDVVLLDPHYKLHGGDANAEREMVDLMRLFDRWRDEYGFAQLLNCHCRKPPIGAKFTMHEFFGSGAILRGAEIVLGLQMKSAGYSRLHFFKDRDGELPVGSEWGLLFDRESGFRRDPNDGKPRETARDRVRTALELEPGLTEQELQERSGNAERTVRDALAAIGATFSTGPDGVKFWTLPEAS